MRGAAEKRIGAPLAPASSRAPRSKGETKRMQYVRGSRAWFQETPPPPTPWDRRDTGFRERIVRRELLGGWVRIHRTVQENEISAQAAQADHPQRAIPDTRRSEIEPSSPENQIESVGLLMPKNQVKSVGLLETVRDERSE
jgi:hypothetical protein